jgi:hypothetical protein
VTFTAVFESLVVVDALDPGGPHAASLRGSAHLNRLAAKKDGFYLNPIELL